MRDPRLFTALEDDTGPDLARQAAAHARARRHRRRTLAGAAIGAVAILAFLRIDRSAAVDTHPGQAISGTVATAPYEILSDEELVRYLADEPVLLLKEHGKVSAVVFLSAPATKL